MEDFATYARRVIRSLPPPETPAPSGPGSPLNAFTSDSMHEALTQLGRPFEGQVGRLDGEVGCDGEDGAERMETAGRLANGPPVRYDPGGRMTSVSREIGWPSAETSTRSCSMLWLALPTYDA